MVKGGRPDTEIIRLINIYQTEEARRVNGVMDQLRQQMNAASTGITPQMPNDITVDLSMPSADGNTPLHVAVSVNNQSVVTYLLLKKRVDPMAKGASGLLPLEMACALGSCPVVGLLLRDKRTRLNHCHPKRGTVLHIAAGRENFQLVQLLLLNQIDLSL